jgi:hypothetical protein
MIERDRDLGDRIENCDIRSLANEPPSPAGAALRRRHPAIAIRLRSGEPTNHVHERAYLLVADGEIEISQDRSSATGGSGFLSHFEPNKARSLGSCPQGQSRRHPRPVD